MHFQCCQTYTGNRTPRQSESLHHVHCTSSLDSDRLNIVFLKLILCVPAVFPVSFALYFGCVTLGSKEIHCWNIRTWKKKKKKPAPLSPCNRYCFRMFVLEFKIKDMLISVLFNTFLSYTKTLVFIWQKLLMLKQKLF